jgi:hypothetical protein
MHSPRSGFPRPPDSTRINVEMGVLHVHIENCLWSLTELLPPPGLYTVYFQTEGENEYNRTVTGIMLYGYKESKCNMRNYFADPPIHCHNCPKKALTTRRRTSTCGVPEVIEYLLSLRGVCGAARVNWFPIGSSGNMCPNTSIGNQSTARGKYPQCFFMPSQ